MVRLRGFYLLPVLAVLISDPMAAQRSPGAYVDREGVLRWAADRQEVAEFGVHYALPFSTAYANFQDLGLDFETGLRQDVYHLTRLGLKAYRVHMWDAELTDTLGNLQHNEHLRLLDLTVKEMKDRGFKMLLTPLNYYGTREKPYGIGQKWGKTGSYTPDAVAATKNYLRQLMEHVNPYTGNAYKDDEDIIGYEIYNEPEHPGFTEEAAVTYINSLVEVIRQAGCRKPLFWCMSIAPHLIRGFVKADVQGGSMQWYSVSHNAGFPFKGNLLTHVDQWPKDTLTDVVRAARKALVSYEMDAADNGYSYTYPMMARSMREAGFQFAAMFSYDPLYIAAYNTEYRTHYMNLAYAPKKAMGLKIAGEVFRSTPRLKQFGRFPQDTTFGCFHVSHDPELAEMVSEEKFFYSGDTQSVPPAISSLKEIAGIGSSCLVRYAGRGIYFLDKLEDGVWRLELMPDATWVDNPFGRPELGREMSAIVWETYPMTIDLPDLGEGFSLRGINDGNDRRSTAIGRAVEVSPGTYLLEAADRHSALGPDDRWKDIVLGEFAAPKPTRGLYLVYTPMHELSRNVRPELSLEVISQRAPDAVRLEAFSLSPSRFPALDFERDGRYGWKVSLPEEMLREDMLAYRIAVVRDGKTVYYPEDVSGGQMDYINTAMYQLRIVDPEAPVVLLNVAEDLKELRRNHRHYPYRFRPSVLPGLAGVCVASDGMVYASHYVSDRTAGRRSDLPGRKAVVVRAYARKGPSSQVWVVLQGTDGLEYGTQFRVGPDARDYRIPLSDFKRVRVTGPGEKGFVYVDRIPEENTYLDIRKVETVKMAVLPQDNPEGASVFFEYITLD
ncbi:MAG: hypothetical protein IJ653_05990 [Bacteroidales bacterium]|nr:hypothetical protein [Bacteroidales bacterium]